MGYMGMADGASAQGTERNYPHPLDPVFEAEPPDELKHLHFGDSYMLARKAYEKNV